MPRLRCLARLNLRMLGTMKMTESKMLEECKVQLLWRWKTFQTLQGATCMTNMSSSMCFCLGRCSEVSDMDSATRSDKA